MNDRFTTRRGTLLLATMHPDNFFDCISSEPNGRAMIKRPKPRHSHRQKLGRSDELGTYLIPGMRVTIFADLGQVRTDVGAADCRLADARWTDYLLLEDKELA